MRFALAIARTEFRLTLRDPFGIVIMFGMPLLVIPVLKNASGTALQSSGFIEASGAEHIVPGQTVLFGGFLASTVAFSFFREYGWQTWERVRASPAPKTAIVAGKLGMAIAFGLVQHLILFTVGALFLDLDVLEVVPQVFVLSTAFIASLVGLGVLLIATIDHFQAVNAAVNLGAILFGAVGGALVPRDQLPGWAQAIAPFTPHYWAMKGYTALFLDHGGFADIAVPASVLAGVALVSSAIAAHHFEFTDTKTAW